VVPFTIPAFVALLFKAVLFVYALRAPRHNATTRLFLALLALFTLHNLVEFFGLNHLVAHGVDTVMVRCGYAYFAIGIVFFAVLLHLSLRLSADDFGKWRRLVPLIYLPVPVLEYLLLGTDQLVTGFRMFDSYTIVRIAGPWYFLFETYAPLYLLIAVVYLVYGARRSRRPALDRLRNRLWLFALLPFVLLNVYLIVANHFGLARLSSTFYLPLALTFFLAVTTYATHNYRLFDITFYVPWSRLRREKRAFYRAMDQLAGDLADVPEMRIALERLSKTLRCPVALVGGPQAVAIPLNEPDATLSDMDHATALAEIPLGTLERIDRAVIAGEVARGDTELGALLRQHRVAAVVPFRAHAQIPVAWLLLGEPFSETVYSRLDHQTFTTVCAALSSLFLDRLLLLQTQLAEARAQVRDYQDRLAHAWETQIQLSERLRDALQRNETLSRHNAALRRETFHLVGPRRDDPATD
jgi:N-terminal 7TM region of histidine kinase